jgi:hypothetical protein
MEERSTPPSVNAGENSTTRSLPWKASVLTLLGGSLHEVLLRAHEPALIVALPTGLYFWALYLLLFDDSRTEGISLRIALYLLLVLSGSLLGTAIYALAHMR